MAYKETQFLRVTCGLFGILSYGMAFAVGASAQFLSIPAYPVWALTPPRELCEPGGTGPSPWLWRRHSQSLLPAHR